MNRFYRVLAAVTFSLLLLCPVKISPVFGAYMYTDNPQQNPEDNEYLDENGNVIKEEDYEAKLKKQAEELQKNATAPFGKAGAGFGSAKAKMQEMKTINSQFPGEKKEESESSTFPTSSGIFDSSAAKEKDKDSPAAAPPPAKAAPSKPRVLVS